MTAHTISITKKISSTTKRNLLVILVHYFLFFKILDDRLRKYIATRKKITPLMNSSSVCSSTRDDDDALTNAKLMNMIKQNISMLMSVTFLKPFFWKPFIFISNPNISPIVSMLTQQAITKKISLQNVITLKSMHVILQFADITRRDAIVEAARYCSHSLS